MRSEDATECALSSEVGRTVDSELLSLSVWDGDTSEQRCALRRRSSNSHREATFRSRTQDELRQSTQLPQARYQLSEVGSSTIRDCRNCLKFVQSRRRHRLASGKLTWHQSP